ncbi:MAG: hypothetical protein QXP36_06130 [Conexivisphaerales archaeon]
MEKEINIALIVLIPIIITLFFTRSIYYFSIYAIASYISLASSVAIISKLYKVDLSLPVFSNFIVFSVVITIALDLFGIYAPVFIFPLISFNSKQIIKSTKYSERQQFDIYFNLLAVAIAFFSAFSYFGLTYLAIGALISFFISSMPISPNLIGPKLVFGKPVGFLILLAYLIISLALNVLFPLASVALSLLISIYIYTVQFKNARA